MSDQVSIHTALSRVMGALPAIGKDAHASQQQGGYAYRGIEAITREVQGLFAKYGVVVVPRVRSIETRDLTVNSKPWTDTTLIVDYTLTGPDGSTLDATTVGIGRDNADKGANKAMTQAFKYLLLQVLCIFLCVTSPTSEQAVRDAFRELARTHHPDHGGDPETFRRIVEARDMLDRANPQASDASNDRQGDA